MRKKLVSIMLATMIATTSIGGTLLVNPTKVAASQYYSEPSKYTERGKTKTVNISGNKVAIKVSNVTYNPITIKAYSQKYGLQLDTYKNSLNHNLNYKIALIKIKVKNKSTSTIHSSLITEMIYPMFLDTADDLFKYTNHVNWCPSSYYGDLKSGKSKTIYLLAAFKDEGDSWNKYYLKLNTPSSSYWFKIK